MIIVLKNNITPEQKNHILNLIPDDGSIVKELSDDAQNVIGIIGRQKLDKSFFENLPGVEKVVPISKPFKLVSRDLHPEDSVIPVGNIVVGAEHTTVIAGPCAVESRQQALAIAEEVRRYGAVMFRGGAFKPRTSPYSFQGLEEEGLKILAEVREKFGLPVVTEITSPAQADLMAKYVDVVQIGARNMQNFELLKCVGRMKNPVLLKRGLSATFEEWLMSAEYILSEGNENVMLCERGIRTFESHTRNTLDLSAISVLKKLTHLPVIIDPSHATGIRELVTPMARGAVAAGADGLIIEVHNQPEKALSDGPQSLYPKQFAQLMRDIYVISPVVGKQLDFTYLDRAAGSTGPGQNKSSEKSPGKSRTAFPDEAGTFNHKACIQYFGQNTEPVSMPTSRAVFEAVKDGSVKFGLVPLENSLTGSIHENYDLLLEYDLKIIGEVTLRIIHSLAGIAGAEFKGIKKVFSVPQVSRECRQFLDLHPEWELLPVKNTKAAALNLKQENSPSYAAITSRDFAEEHGLQVMEHGIETNPRNFNRYIVIASESAAKDVPGSKSSIVFSSINKPGALLDSLHVFSDNNINMVKLESRPIHGKPWEYMFYVDIEADAQSKDFAPVMDALKKKTDFIKILGAY